MKKASWKLRNLELRDYQLRLSEELAQNRRQNYIIWAPVGMGKTIIAYLAVARAHNLGRLQAGKVIIIPHSRAMVNQWCDFAQKLGLSEYAKVATSREISNYSKFVYGKTRIRRKIQEKAKKKNLYREADVVISTPRLFSKDLSEKIFEKRQIEQVDMVFIDEVSKIMTPNPKDPIWTYDTKKDYALILESFKLKQLIGLTATPGDLYELRMLEEKLQAITIGPSIDDTEKYSFDVKTQKHYIIDPWVEELDKKIKTIIGANLGIISKRLESHRSGLYSSHMLRVVTSLINHTDSRVSSAAKSVVKAIYMRLLLLERSFRALFDYVSDIEVEGESWDRIKQLTADRARSDPYSSKMRQSVKIIKLSTEKGKKILVFNRYIDGCEELKDALQQAGIGSDIVTGNMGLDEQGLKFREFNEGQNEVLISTVGVGGAGVDLPNADVVIQYGLSTSAFQMEQRKGRIRGGVEKCLVYKHTREDRKFDELQSRLASIGDKINRLNPDSSLRSNYRNLVELLTPQSKHTVN